MASGGDDPQSDSTHSIVVMWVKIFKTEKPIDIQLVRLNEVCGKVLIISEKKCLQVC